MAIACAMKRLPSWVDSAYADFAKRFPPELTLELKAVKAEARGSRTAQQAMAAEALRIQAALPRKVHRVILDEHGERLTTAALATRLERWMQEGCDVAFIVGGPDGLDATLKTTADETWRLSDLTLPHAFVRVWLAEALYRAWTVTTHHPYHRE